ncbi:MAG: type II toxin-antitoxin system VapC family toxin [Synechococcaceae cyanobacterium SM2_3_2]|nr:type II toxin-antitoxin system VapC family toxin [Synechococcaceae cyanobacterium SM2_3_2]
MTAYHYLDACIFLGYLNSDSEPAHAQECQTIIKAAEEGIIRVVTSAFSESEVIDIKDPKDPSQKLDPKLCETIIKQLFEMPWLELAAYEREVAEISRYITRTYGIKPVDATHVATAIRMQVDYFNTVDDALLKKFPRTVSYPDNPKYAKQIILQRPFVEGYNPLLF